MNRTVSKVLVLTLVALVVNACGGGKSNQQQANDLVNIGLQQQVNGQVDLAAATYQEALKKDPQNKFAYFDLGTIDQAANRLDAAENEYRLALGIDPNFEGALYNLAIVRTAAGYPVDAIALYRSVIAVDANNAAAHLNLGLLLRANGSPQEADAELNTAITLDPTLAPRATPPAEQTPANAPGTPAAGETAEAVATPTP